MDNDDGKKLNRFSGRFEFGVLSIERCRLSDKMDERWMDGG